MFVGLTVYFFILNRLRCTLFNYSWVWKWKINGFSSSDLYPGYKFQKTSPRQYEDKKSKNQTLIKPTRPPLLGSRAPAITAEQQMKQTAFERVVYDMSHNETVITNIILGKRIGFYELRGEIGAGNFSHVRLGVHGLTKGEPLQTIFTSSYGYL